MYLKQVEITGFKSFADKTRLQFNPGMVAIVGPNGCGKSNVSDAIRWVLGEQRPTQLRCAHMADVVFNGTDSRKQLGMAEVSITFAECEKALGTEFNEVTITRRVFRSGEGQYFINKTPCRLKDVNRLFMGTGIGTTSYSVMAQGQIDAILSSRPEDRRAVFEEAAGITKFKADRKEALRKLDQTSANMVRLDDMLREVKRQIGSMQRQAGKARRYNELHTELRGLDIFLTKRRIAALDERLAQIDESLQLLDGQIQAHQDFVAEQEAASSRMHAEVHEIEEQINRFTEQAAQADNAFIRAQEVIKTNRERIDEYKAWAERDNLEISTTQRQIDQMKLQVDSLEQKRLLTVKAMESEKVRLDEAQEKFDSHREELEATRTQLQRDRQQQVVCERRCSEIQQKLTEMDNRQREILLKRDRLTAEHAQLSEALAVTEKTRDEIASRLAKYREGVEQCEARFETLEESRTQAADELHQLQEENTRMQSEAAATRAKLDLLNASQESADDYSGGSKLLLDASNPLSIERGEVLGTLAEKITAEPDLRLAVEASLRAWLDAIVVRDAATAQALFSKLLAHGEHSAAKFILSVGTPPPPRNETPSGLPRLLDCVTVDADFAEAAERLIGRVYLTDSQASIPQGWFENAHGLSVVTREGVIFHGDGSAELWMPDNAVSSPLARRMLVSQTSGKLEELQRQIEQSKRRLEELNARVSELTLDLQQTRRELDEDRRKAAQTEGEFQAIDRDASRARERLQNVERELNAVKELTASDDEERIALTEEFDTLSRQRVTLLNATQEASARLEVMEGVYSQLSQELTEARIQVSSLSQQLTYTDSQRNSVQEHIDELNKTIEGRNSGLQSYQNSIEKLNHEIEQLTGSLEPLQLASEELHGKIDATRQVRLAKQDEIDRVDASLLERRRMLDGSRENKTKAELEHQESSIRRQNHFDHIRNEYDLDEQAFIAEADPPWKETKGVPPPIPEIEQRVQQLSADIQALGPVNFAAIEDYKALEERYAFLKAQEEDLTNAKTEVLNVIQQINTQSYEMFKKTFDQANENFRTMFTKLFNGGEARLVMLENQEDPLECGVDIIARPPGKRPQSVTLLSGGERTMTAVSLLFAIFMIKPAPFCILDELDAALDDSNIGRFVEALKGFLSHSQFLIITHNQHTIAGSDMVYGVTQQEKGVSKILSISLADIGKKGEIKV
ncbi:MAG: chromosome segregation protein SMC [Kiritimatiellae bacterium]|nr:chromosome segregation protein SMC [Kiritimatiellia bacterium]